MTSASGRSVPEWIGKTADSRPPASVKARIFARYDGRCYLSGIKIAAGMAWEVEHVVPLWQDLTGNRESNLAPALVSAHSEKTKAEAPVRAKCDRIRAKHLGIFPKSKAKIRSSGFAPSRNRMEDYR